MTSNPLAWQNARAIASPDLHSGTRQGTCPFFVANRSWWTGFSDCANCASAAALPHLTHLTFLTYLTLLLRLRPGYSNFLINSSSPPSTGSISMRPAGGTDGPGGAEGTCAPGAGGFAVATPRSGTGVAGSETTSEGSLSGFSSG